MKKPAKKDSYAILPDLDITSSEREATEDNDSKVFLPVGQKYLINPNDKSSAPRRFFFPGKKRFGHLYWESKPGVGDLMHSKEERPAIGTVLIPAGCHLRLSAGAALAAQPELFKGFGADDLWSLGFSERCDWSDRQVAPACNLSGLRYLSLAEINVTNDCLQYIQNLPNLEGITVSGTNITGAGLAKLKRLRQLTSISASGIQSFKDALGTLVKADHLDTVMASDCNLDDNDLKILSKMNSIALLDVSQNNFTVAGLEEVCKLPKLEQLTVDNTKTTSPFLIVLKKAKKLKKLIVTDLAKEDQLRLENALPRYTVTRGEKRRVYAGSLLNK